jgi:hypothetical protein
MGQYYKIVNLTKREYLEPHAFDEGAKLLEFGCSGSGTMTALAVLLANSNGRGGGDLNGVPEDFPVKPGRWAGDRIVVAGDYAEATDPGEFCGGVNLYTLCSAKNPNTSFEGTEGSAFRDISAGALNLIKLDSCIASKYK